MSRILVSSSSIWDSVGVRLFSSDIVVGGMLCEVFVMRERAVVVSFVDAYKVEALRFGGINVLECL